MTCLSFLFCFLFLCQFIFIYSFQKKLYAVFLNEHWKMEKAKFWNWLTHCFRGNNTVEHQINICFSIASVVFFFFVIWQILIILGENYIFADSGEQKWSQWKISSFSPLFHFHHSADNWSYLSGKLSWGKSDCMIRYFNIELFSNPYTY